MKTIIFNAGLGNQIFTYLFYRYLQRRFPDSSIRGYYLSGGLNTHYGLEVGHVFNISLPESSFFTNILCKIYRACCLLGMRPFLENHEFSWWNPVFDYQWIDKKYYSNTDILSELTFRESNISMRNLQFAASMTQSCHVAVHIRRGDYMQGEAYQNFGRYCTDEYYLKAMAKMKELHPDARFVFFSDDMDYVKEHFSAGNAIFADWNTGSDSWQDMYLMSRCRHHIIANSTFSYWGAMLSVSQSTIHTVIAPKKWYIWDDPDIFPENWVRL